MKHKGSQNELTEERNAELLRAYTKLIGERDKIRMADVAKTLAYMPCSRFWVSEERAYIVIGDMLRGISIEKMNPEKKDMFREIFSRFIEARIRFPSLTRMELLWKICNSPAPRFYLTPNSIIVILHKVRKEAKLKCKESRKNILESMSHT